MESPLSDILRGKPVVLCSGWFVPYKAQVRHLKASRSEGSHEFVPPLVQEGDFWQLQCPFEYLFKIILTSISSTQGCLKFWPVPPHVWSITITSSLDSLPSQPWSKLLLCHSSYHSSLETSFLKTLHDPMSDRWSPNSGLGIQGIQLHVLLYCYHTPVCPCRGPNACFASGIPPTI